MFCLAGLKVSLITHGLGVIAALAVSGVLLSLRPSSTFANRSFWHMEESDQTAAGCASRRPQLAFLWLFLLPFIGSVLSHAVAGR